jgi:hypothetical protein
VIRKALPYPAISAICWSPKPVRDADAQGAAEYGLPGSDPKGVTPPGDP